MAVWQLCKKDVIKTSLWIITNIASSVALILTNKVIMRPPFNFIYAFTLTSIHFLVTAFTMEIMALAQLFSRSSLPWRPTILMSIACALSVGLMNLSLKVNSLGFYQLCKLLGVPWLVLVQAIVYKIHTSWAIKISLTIIIIGMGLATIKYIHISSIGCLVGFAAVVVTVQFQIWQGRNQHQYELNAMQINHAQALPTFFVCAALAITVEFNTFHYGKSVLAHNWTSGELQWIFLSAALAACVNLCSYGLLGYTSTVTFQVVGHMKTILILAASYFLFNEKTQIRWINIIGVTITMFGTVIYGYLSHHESTDYSLCQSMSETSLCKLCRRSHNQENATNESSQKLLKTQFSEEDASKPV